MVFDAGSISIRLLLDTDNLLSGMQKTKASMLEWRNETTAGAADTLRWGAAITATTAPLIAVGYALVDVTNKAAKFGQSLKDNARDLGLSTEQYQRWTHAAIAAGSSAEEITGSIRMLTIRLKEASDPASEAARYLSAMGVSAYDSNGRLRDTNAILKDILPALNALPEGMERNQASMVLFGRSFSNIADLTSLSRDELQKLMDQAPVFSDEKIQKMDDYAIQTALLNEKIQNLTVDIGTELIPVMEDVLDIINDVSWAASPMMTFIQDAAFGINTLTTGMRLLWLQGPKNSGGEFAAQAQAEYDRVYAEWINRGAALERRQSGYPDMTSFGESDAARRFGGGTSLSVAAAKKAGSDLTQFQIRELQLDYERMTKITIPGQQKELKDLEKQYREIGDRGSDAAKKIKIEIDELTLSIQKNQNQIAEWESKLTGAGAAVTSTGGPTLNTMFASSIQAGGVGPDWAGFSDLAGMSEAQLQEIAKGGLGKSKAMAEKAQQYLSMMKSAPASAASKKAEVKPGTAAETASVKSELKDQGAAFTELNTTIKSGWSELEQTGIIHWKAMGDMAKTTYQYIMDAAAQAVNFAGSNPIIQKVVTLSKEGYDIDPSPLPQITAPKLADIDFSGVQFSGGAGAAGTQAGGGTTVNVEQNVTVVSPQGTPAQNAAALRKANQGLGSLVSSGVY